MEGGWENSLKKKGNLTVDIQTLQYGTKKEQMR